MAIVIRLIKLLLSPASRAPESAKITRAYLKLSAPTLMHHRANSIKKELAVFTASPSIVTKEEVNKHA